MKRPNILLLTTDQQRWDALGANGNPHVQTPNLDRLAWEGTSFTHHFVQSPLCMPSRVSFLTGQYPSQLGITAMGVPVPPDTPTIATLLKPYGYDCANIGKLHFQPHANRDHRQPHPSYGFDQLEISDEPGVYEDAYRAWVRRQAPGQLPYLSVGLPPARSTWLETMGVVDEVAHPSSGARDDFEKAIPFAGDERFTHSAFVAERTIEFLQRQDGKRPFLCISGFYSPHAPWVVPQRFLDLYDPQTFGEAINSPRHGYYAMVSEVDYHVGRILQQLSASGLAENTIVLFTSDHGEWLGDNGRFGKGYPADDPVSRVPLVVRLPERPQQLSDEKRALLLEAVDVLPTLLALCAVQPPRYLAGRSFMNLLLGRAYEPRRAALTEFSGWKTIRTEQHRYLIHAEGQERLWRIDGEKEVPLALDEHSEILANQRHLLLQKVLGAERPLSRTWPY